MHKTPHLMKKLIKNDYLRAIAGGVASIDGKNVMFVLNEKDDVVLRASNNIPNLKVTYADVLGTYDIVANSKLYITKDAIKKLEEAYK